MTISMPTTTTSVGALGGPKSETDLEILLARSITLGQQTLHDITRRALLRLLHYPYHVNFTGNLFALHELFQLMETLATIRSAGDLLARLLVREYQEKVEGVDTDSVSDPASEKPTIIPVLEAMYSDNLDESIGDFVPLITPESALQYFLGLMPTLGVDPLRYAEDQRRSAFTMAVSTGVELLGRVQGIISKAIETGETVTAAPSMIQKLLDEAGVTPASSGYAEMLFRTNFLDALNTGAMDELRDPDLGDTFPCWEYSAIMDSRVRPWHAKWNGHYFPTSISFQQVRDSAMGKFDGYQCRCTMIPVSRWQWAKLQAKGATLSSIM